MLMIDWLSFLMQGTETRMNNVFNDFLMLANIQFVENVRITLSVAVQTVSVAVQTVYL